MQGHVTSAQTGEPLKKAILSLTRRGASASITVADPQGYSTSSEADGSFRFEGVEPGDYTLSAERTGYLDANYGAKSLQSPARS